MKLLTELTIKNLKLNKKRTIVTIIGVILSAALITAVFGMVDCFRKTLVEESIQDVGYYHLKLNSSPENLKVLEKNRDIKALKNFYEIGYSSLEESNNEYKPYLKLISVENPNSFLEFFDLKEGRFPANEKEVVISDAIRTNGKVTYQIGDKITLNLGKRFACNQEVLKDNYLPSEYRFDDLGNTICEQENLEVYQTLEVSVVGIIERPSFAFEDYSSAGYTILTRDLTSSNIISHIVLKKPANYEKTFDDLKSSNLFSNIDVNYDLLRWEAFAFSDDTMSMLISIAIIVVVIIMVTSIFCIRNSFAISITEKTKMFGMLSSVGATKKQIKKCVLREALIIGLIGIPLGILAGILADFILIIIMNHLLSGFLDNKLFFQVSPLIILIAFILSSITIYMSARKSAKRASKITPIEAIRSSNDLAIKKNLKTPKLISKIFNVGGVIAYKNLKRSKKKYRTTVISLVVSIFVFITMNTFINYAFSLSNVYYQEYDYDMALYFNYNELNYQTVFELEGIDDYNFFYYPKDSAIIKDLSHLTDYGNSYFGYDNNSKDDSLRVNVILLDEHTFKKYLQENKLNYEKNKDKLILVDSYLQFQENGQMIEKRMYDYKKNDKIAITFKDDLDEKETREFTIGAVLTKNPDGQEHRYDASGFLYLNQAYYSDLNIRPWLMTINTKDSRKLEDDISKLKLEVEVNNIDEEKSLEKAIYIVVAIFLYGFITVITLIGVTNIFNTITANMALRQKEFLVLKSIGMTRKEFKHMINLETIFYSFKALFYGIILGLIGSFLVYKAFAVEYDNGFNIPYKPIIIAIIFVMLLVFMIMRYSIHKINKQNIIETIRNENI